MGTNTEGKSAPLLNLDNSRRLTRQLYVPAFLALRSNTSTENNSTFRKTRCLNFIDFQSEINSFLFVLGVFVLRRVFASKRDEVTGEWRRLHIKELYALYSSPTIFQVMKSRRLRWAGHVARMGERSAYRALVGKPEGSRQLERPRRRWGDNIKIDLREDELGGGGTDWIHLAHDRDMRRAVVNTVMNHRVP
jgi:hypothetical protein